MKIDSVNININEKWNYIGRGDAGHIYKLVNGAGQMRISLLPPFIKSWPFESDKVRALRLFKKSNIKIDAKIKDLKISSSFGSGYWVTYKDHKHGPVCLGVLFGKVTLMMSLEGHLDHIETADIMHRIT